MAEKKAGNEKKKVLVADISGTVRRLMVNYLKDEHDVVEAQSGAETLGLVQKFHECDSRCLRRDKRENDAEGKQRFSAILLGLEMEDLTAFEITAQLRKKHSKTCLPVIISTSNNRRETVIRALESGANDVIVKPFHKELLVSKIHKLEHVASPEVLKASELISAIPFFHGVSVSQVAYILNTCGQTITKGPGETICRQDEENYDLFILLEGKCEVVFNNRKVGEIAPIDTIGEMGFVANAKRSATVKASAPSKVIVINKQKFDDYLNEERAISEMIMRNIILSLNERIKKSNSLINKLKLIAEEYLSE